jgi:hypothetical protein
MGVFGGILGAGVGRIAGGMGGQYFGGDQGQEVGQNVGGTVGGALGTLLPFRTGGRIPGPKGRPRPILAHCGEYVLPVGVKPTKAQIKMVANKKRNC